MYITNPITAQIKFLQLNTRAERIEGAEKIGTKA